MRYRPLFMTLLFLGASAPAAPARAQNQSQQPVPPNASANDAASATDQQAPKKVWTNDDFDAHDANPSSGAGAKPKSVRTKPVPQNSARANWYRNQISKLNAQIPEIDQKIASYQSALNGNPQPAQGLEEYHLRRADWLAEIQKLTKQKQDLLAKIAALEDQASKEGIAPGQLR